MGPFVLSGAGDGKAAACSGVGRGRAGGERPQGRREGIDRSWDAKRGQECDHCLGI